MPAATRSAARARHVRGNQPIAAARRRGQRGNGPERGQLAGAKRDLVVRRALRAKESQHGRDRRLADVAVAQAIGREPVLVELQPLRQRSAIAPCRQAARRRPIRASVMISSCSLGPRRPRFWPAARRDGSAVRTRAAWSSHGRSIIVRQVEVLQRVAAEVFVVAHDPERFADLGLTVHRRSRPGHSAPSAESTPRSTPRAAIACSSSPATCRSSTIDCCSRAGSTRPSRATARGCARHAASSRSSRVTSATRAPRSSRRFRRDDSRPATSARSCAWPRSRRSELDRFGSADELLANVNTPEDYARVQYRASMILPVHAAVRTALADTLATRFSIAPDDQPAIVIELPPQARARRSGGARRVRAGAPAAQGAARHRAGDRRRARPDRRRRTRRGHAQRVPQLLSRPRGVHRTVARRTRQRLAPNPAARSSSSTPRSTRTRRRTSGICAMRRSATRSCGCSAFRAAPVEVQNYIDDTGVQVADVVVGFTTLEGRDLAGVQALIADPAVRFDYYCWDLYARVTEWYAADKTRLEIRSAALHAIEEGGNALAEIAAFVADRIVRAHLDTMARLNVGYDLLTWEGDILRLHFWATAFEQLKATGAVFLRDDGRLKGCWVMPIGDGADAQGADETETPADEDERRSAREGHRALERHGHLRRQGHRESVLEVRPARHGTFTTGRSSRGRPHGLGDDVVAVGDGPRAGVRPRVGGVQRHRHAPVVPSGTAQAGARHHRVHGAGGELDAFFVRDGRAVTRDGPGARLWRPESRTASRSSRCPAARASASRPTT